MARTGHRGLNRLIAALSRLAGAAAVMLIVATLAFAALQLIPGDPAEAALGGPGSQASAEALAAARVEFCLLYTSRCV